LKPQTRSLRAALLEGLVIVVSILVAFGLDATWARYGEAQAERDILRSLHDEFEDARSRIEGAIAEAHSSLAATAKLMDHLGPSPPELSSDSAEALVVAILAVNTLEVPAGALNSLLASGELRLVRSDSLRAALARWPALVADVRENYDWQRQTTDGVLIPHIAPYISVRSALSRLAFTDWGPSDFDLDPALLQRDPVFEGLLTLGAARQQAGLVESEVLLKACREMLALIELELGGNAS